MENQAIEKRYLDRQLMIALLERLFPDNYIIEVRPRSLKLHSVRLSMTKIQEQPFRTVLTIPRKLTEVGIRDYSLKRMHLRVRNRC
jgi:hypothetical protein